MRPHDIATHSRTAQSDFKVVDVTRSRFCLQPTMGGWALALEQAVVNFQLGYLDPLVVANAVDVVTAVGFDCPTLYRLSVESLYGLQESAWGNEHQREQHLHRGFAR